MSAVAGDEEGFIFPGEPKPVNIEKEAEALSGGGTLPFEPKKLAASLIILGETLLGVRLYSYQRGPAYRIIYSMLVGDGALVTMLFARQSGKSEVVTFTIIVIGVLFPVFARFWEKELGQFKDGVKMGLFAPQQDQVETVYVRAMERISSPEGKALLSDPDINDKLLSKVNFRLRSGSFLKAQTGAKQSKIESKTYHIVFIDEAQDMDREKVRKSIIPMTASTFGTIVRLGTPNRVKGDFYDIIMENKKQDRKRGGGSLENQMHFQFDYKDVIKAKREMFNEDGRKFHTLYEKSVQRDMVQMGGVKSESFRMAYGLEWLFDAGMFITDTELERNVFKKNLGFPDIKDNSFVVAGLDIASARANTVLTLGVCTHPMENEYENKPVKTVCDWIELEGSYEEQYPILEDAIVQNRVKILYLDYTGVGRAVGDRLMHNLGDFVTIVPYMFTIPSKSDMWKNMEEEISAGRAVVPAHPTVRQTQEFKNFEEQMLYLQKGWKGSYLLAEKTQGYKDDYPDSWGLMLLAGNHLMTDSVMEVTDNNMFAPSARNHRKSSW